MSAAQRPPGPAVAPSSAHHEMAARLEHLGTENAYLVSNEAFARKAAGHVVYPFHIGDLNFSTPGPIVEACKAALDAGKTRYCDFHGVQALRAAMAANIGRERGITLSEDEVVVQPGGKPVIAKFLQTVMNPGDEVLYPSPGYPIYESQIEFLGGRCVPYTFREGAAGFEIDMASLRSKVTGNTKVLIYNNYQNPTGATSSDAEMAEIARLAVDNDLWVLSDEAYFHLLFDGRLGKSIIALPGMRERTVLLVTTSKSWAMTGWRVGAAVGPRAVCDMIAKLVTNDEGCSNQFVQWGAIAAFTDPGGVVSRARGEMVAKLQQRRDLMYRLINEIPGFRAFLPVATFYLYVNATEAFRIVGHASYEGFRKQLLRDTGVSFCTREHFGQALPGETEKYVRFAYSGSRTDDHILPGMQTLKRYMEQKEREYRARALPRVFATRQCPQLTFDLIRPHVDLEVWEGEDGPPRDVLLAKAKECDGLITLLTDEVDEELLAAAPRLRLISQLAVGFNNIDLAACTRHGVAVTNTPGVLTDTVVETTFALLFAASRRIAECDRYTRAGEWNVSWHPLMKLGWDLKGATLGIVGLGRIGQQVCDVARAFGARVVYHDLRRNRPFEDKGVAYLSLDDLCRTSDFITLHTLLCESTHHLINAERLAMMKKNCVLVNTSRGPIVDQRALAAALESGTIFGAGLDVFEQEPVAKDDPLFRCPNAVIVPHIGSASFRTREAMGTLVARNQIAFWTGTPLVTLVNQDWQDTRANKEA